VVPGVWLVEKCLVLYQRRTTGLLAERSPAVYEFRVNKTTPKLECHTIALMSTLRYQPSGRAIPCERALACPISGLAHHFCELATAGRLECAFRDLFAFLKVKLEFRVAAGTFQRGCLANARYFLFLRRFFCDKQVSRACAPAATDHIVGFMAVL